MPAHPVTERLLAYLAASPTPFHAVAEAVRQLAARGALPVDLAAERPRLEPGDVVYVTESGSLFAVRIGSAPVTEAGWRIVAAHTDSPNLRVKPQPLIRSQGYVRLGLEVYGGVQLATWVDRDLGLAGVVHLRDPHVKVRTALVDLRRPLCRIPTLAIHLNREVNAEGLKLNAQTQLPAVLALSDGDDDPLRELLSAELGVPAGDILTWDLQLYDLQAPSLGGAHEEFVVSGRLDNLASSHAGLEALLATLDGPPPAATSVLALFDHEEIGSQSDRGANSRAIEEILELCLDATGAPGSARASRALARSWLLSADMAHAVHPAFADKHDAEHMPRLNRGVVIKQNANKRYATESDVGARFLLLCEEAGVPVQWYVHRADLACGSTVGPMLASRLGVPSIDVGNPMLSMHSSREQAGAHDHPHMVRAMVAFFGS